MNGAVAGSPATPAVYVDGTAAALRAVVVSGCLTLTVFTCSLFLNTNVFNVH